MTSLKLSPLPTLRPDPATEPRVGESEGFVDDSVVISLMKGPVAQRLSGDFGDLVLTADEMDFAGWSLGASLPRRSTEAPARRAAPPVLEEAGIGHPHTGSHRWWLAGVAGALSTMLASLLLYTLGSRNMRENQEFSVIKAPPKELRQFEKHDPQRAWSPELTGAPAGR